MHDHMPNLVFDGILLTIIIAYLGIALQFWARRRSAPAGGRATSALNQLVVIFVFCAVCGYLPRIAPIPALPLLVAHVVLACAAWAYLLSRQVDRLSLAVDGADRDDPAARAHRRAAEHEALDSEAEACARLVESTGNKVAAGLIRQRVAARQRKRGDAPPLLQDEATAAA